MLEVIGCDAVWDRLHAVKTRVSRDMDLIPVCKSGIRKSWAHWRKPRSPLACKANARSFPIICPQPIAIETSICALMSFSEKVALWRNFSALIELTEIPVTTLPPHSRSAIWAAAERTWTILSITRDLTGIQELNSFSLRSSSSINLRVELLTKWTGSSAPTNNKIINSVEREFPR